MAIRIVTPHSDHRPRCRVHFLDSPVRPSFVSTVAVRKHSPTGPAWGYGGSGPAQLALAILLAVTDEATAAQFYQKFKWDVLAPIEADRWALAAGDVLGWLESASGTDEVVRLAVEES